MALPLVFRVIDGGVVELPLKITREFDVRVTNWMATLDKEFMFWERCRRPDLGLFFLPSEFHPATGRAATPPLTTVSLGDAIQVCHRVTRGPVDPAQIDREGLRAARESARARWGETREDWFGVVLEVTEHSLVCWPMRGGYEARIEGKLLRIGQSTIPITPPRPGKQEGDRGFRLS